MGLLKILLSVIAVGAVIASSTAEASYQSGQALERNGDYFKSSIAYFKSQNDARSLLGMARVLNRLDMKIASIHYLTRAIKESDPDEALPESIAYLSQVYPNQWFPPFYLTEMVSKIPRRHRKSFSFYRYIAGLRFLEKRRYRDAIINLKQVERDDPVHWYAQFNQAIAWHLSGKPKRALQILLQISRSRYPDQALQDWVAMNIGRIYFELENYPRALRAYSDVTRGSEAWLQSIFEGTWTFFYLKRPGNTLGLIHTLRSPYFSQRFFPETYVIEAITYMKLCRFDAAKRSASEFQSIYGAAAKRFPKLISSLRKKRRIYSTVKQYQQGRLTKFKKYSAFFDNLAHSESFQSNYRLETLLAREERLYRAAPPYWQAAMLPGLLDFAGKERDELKKRAESGLYRDGVSSVRLIRTLHEQVKLIKAEMLLGKVSELRGKIAKKPKADDFVGGMNTLKEGERIEYWPFSGEYWQDELGEYVHNIGSHCGKS